MRRVVCLGIALTVTMACSLTSAAHEIKAGTLLLHHPWVHAAKAGSASTDGYLMIRNMGSKPDRLLGATLEGAGAAVVVQLSVPSDAGALCRLDKGLEIAPGELVELKPGKIQLLFGAVARSLRQDIYATGTLLFEQAGPVNIEFFIESADAKTASHAATGALAACPGPLTQ